MKIPQLARYNGVVSKAYEFVIENIREFPVDPFNIIKNFNWKLISYSELAQRTHCTVKDVEECFGKDAYSVYDIIKNKYTIAYNADIGSIQRIKFSLMHEIGHIVLNHLRDFEHTSAKTVNITNDEYKILENEANCFARNVLAPAPLVHSLDTFDYYFRLKNLFNLSLGASNTRRNFLNNDLYYLSEDQIQQMQFSYNRNLVCKNCLNKNLNINDNSCSICGNNKLMLGDVFAMRSYGEHNKKLQACPKCENYDIHPETENYCKICGLKLKNECISCGIELTYNARFCPKCGCMSSYYEADALPSWENETNYSEVREISFLKDSDEDLPF